MLNHSRKRQNDGEPNHGQQEHVKGRLPSIDVIRGLVMWLMALDHTRIFFCSVGLAPVATIDPALFATRWLTNFCAPAFFFLAGTSAYLRQDRGGGARDQAVFLITRGVWLIVLELTLIRLAWTFNFAFDEYNLAGVIWALGWSMILLAGLVFVPSWIAAIVGLGLIAMHNLIPLAGQADSAAAGQFTSSWLWQILYSGGQITIGAEGPALLVLYTLIPWFGVMAAGYAFGRVLTLAPLRRRRVCILMGIGAIAVFAVLRGANLYGEPRPWSLQPSLLRSVMSFFHTSKYPASLQFVLMTLGPTILAIGLLDRARGPLIRLLTIYGRTPFLFYVLHIPLIHFGIVVVCLVRTSDLSPWLFSNQPLAAPPPPPEIGFGVPVVWLVTALVIGCLYFPCRAMSELKKRSHHKLLSYV